MGPYRIQPLNYKEDYFYELFAKKENSKTQITSSQ